MQEGGQPFSGGVVMPEVDDGSVGGFNRPELRGLRKQARRGTLTNRERRRLNYLTNEAKGRRRRGLLSGLGGAAAALGTAALIKSGGAKGLMDSIKSKMSGLKEGLETRREEREIGKEMKPSKEDRNIEMAEVLPPATNVAEERGLVGVDESGAAMRQLMEDGEKARIDAELEENVVEGGSGGESFGKGQTYSTEDMLEALSNAKTPEEEQAIVDKMGATGSTPNPKAMERLEEEIEKTIGEKRGFKTTPVDPDNPYSVKNRKTVMEGSGGPLNPDDFSLEEGEEVDLPIDPAVLGAVRGGGPPLRSQSPMAPTAPGEGERGAGPGSELLRNHNEQRIAMGLKPVMEITESSLMELEAGPLRRLKPLSPKQIARQAVGGMVKRMTQRYN